MHHRHRLQPWHLCPYYLQQYGPKEIKREEWTIHLVPQPSSSHMRKTLFCNNHFGSSIDFLYWNTTRLMLSTKVQKYVCPLSYEHFIIPLTRDLKTKVMRIHECFNEVAQEQSIDKFVNLRIGWAH